MKYTVTIELSRESAFKAADTRERLEQLLLPEHYPVTLTEFREITAPLKVASITVYPEYSE